MTGEEKYSIMACNYSNSSAELFVGVALTHDCAMVVQNDELCLTASNKSVCVSWLCVFRPSAVGTQLGVEKYKHKPISCSYTGVTLCFNRKWSGGATV